MASKRKLGSSSCAKNRRNKERNHPVWQVAKGFSRVAPAWTVLQQTAQTILISMVWAVCCKTVHAGATRLNPLATCQTGWLRSLFLRFFAQDEEPNFLLDAIYERHAM